MGRFSREKGKRGERAVAQLLRLNTGKDVRRRVRQTDGDSDLVGFGHWVVEVKFANLLRLDEWWRQAQAQTDDGLPVLIYKQSNARQPWRVRCRLTDVAIPSRLHVGVFEPELKVDMTMDDWLVAIGEWNPAD